MRDLDLTSLRLFVAVCEARSITRVAETETIVVSAISKRLRQLEEDVGATLLTRSKAGVRPTQAGETLLQHAHDVREKLEEIERDMSEHAQHLRGHVRLFAPSTVVAEYLPEDLAVFLRLQGHEHVQIELEEHLSDRIVFSVKEGVATVGICWDAVDTEDLEIREYRRNRLGVVMNADHPLAHLDRLDYSQTLEYDMIGMRTPGSLPVTRAGVMARPPRTKRYRAVVASFDAAIRLARAGLGLAIASEVMVRRSGLSKELKFVPLVDPWADRRFVICATNFSTLNTAARKLVDHLSMAGRQV